VFAGRPTYSTRRICMDEWMWSQKHVRCLVSLVYGGGLWPMNLTGPEAGRCNKEVCVYMCNVCVCIDKLYVSVYRYMYMHIYV
jgi:hypothetical protein